MILYPNNQIYVIFPIFLSTEKYSEKPSLGRKRKDKKYYIWNYDKTDPVLQHLAKNKECTLLTHSEAIEKMNEEEWKSEEIELQEIQS